MAIFGPKHWVFGQQNEICGQNATRDLFLYHQKGAACKIWANSDGSFSRSGVEWNKRLKLNFWYRTRAGGPTPPSKVRVDRWGRPPRRARLNRETRGRWGSWKIRVVLSSDNEVIFTFGFQKTHHFFSFQSSSSVSKHLLTALVALQNVLRMLCSQCVCHRRQNDA